MWQILETPFGNFRMISVCITIGTLLALFAAGIVIYINTKKIRDSIIGIVASGLVMAMSYPGQILNTLNSMSFKSTEDFFQKVFVNPTGNHFLGRVLVMAVVLPIFYRVVVKDKEKTEIFLDGTGIMIVVQHIFNRIGCFCNGCCYGKPYSGLFSVRYSEDIVAHSVYPSQCIEALFMVVLLAVGIIRLRRKKHIFTMLLIGFGFGIFISEFFYVQTGNVLLAGLNIIQYASIILIVIGICREKMYGKNKHTEKKYTKKHTVKQVSK